MKIKTQHTKPTGHNEGGSKRQVHSTKGLHLKKGRDISYQQLNNIPEMSGIEQSKGAESTN